MEDQFLTPERIDLIIIGLGVIGLLVGIAARDYRRPDIFGRRPMATKNKNPRAERRTGSRSELGRG